MGFKQVLKGTILPKVSLKEMFTAYDGNNEKNTQSVVKVGVDKPDSAQRYGSTEPFVMIGSIQLPEKALDYLKIDETGFLPRVMLSFKDKEGIFSGNNFPKTDTLVSVYIKVTGDVLKPIRCDFLITDVKSSASGKLIPSAKNIDYTIFGELFVPKLYANVSKSYRNMSSKDALKAIATDLGLGFAENDSAPNDSMTWVNTNTTYFDFIKDIAAHSYQNEDSFFEVYIDKWYYLNYINVQVQLSPGEVQKTMQVSPDTGVLETSQINANGADTNLTDTELPIFLSTDSSKEGKSVFIEEYSLLSEQGRILKKNGYKKQIYYYDHFKEETESKNKFTTFNMNAIYTSDSSGNIPLIPENKEFRESLAKKWMNINYGNTHREWNAARLLNDHNLKELRKIMLFARVNGINFQIVRGMKVPVEIKLSVDDNISKNRQDTELEKTDSEDAKKNNMTEVVDTQLSSAYYIGGAKFIFDSLGKKENKFHTEYFLMRREWKQSDK
jgi:hypothetical protein